MEPDRRPTASLAIMTRRLAARTHQRTRLNLPPSAVGPGAPPSCVGAHDVDQRRPRRSRPRNRRRFRLRLDGPGGRRRPNPPASQPTNMANGETLGALAGLLVLGVQTRVAQADPDPDREGQDHSDHDQDKECLLTHRAQPPRRCLRFILMLFNVCCRHASVSPLDRCRNAPDSNLDRCRRALDRQFETYGSCNPRYLEVQK